MKFLFDNTLPPKLAKALNIIVQPEHEVWHVNEKLSADIEDQDWTKALGLEGFVIVTTDLRSEKNSYEIRALDRSNRPLLILKSGWIDMPFWRQMNILTKSLPKIIEAVQRMGSDQPLGLMTSGKVHKMPSLER